jgi:hypothetical protein
MSIGRGRRLHGNHVAVDGLQAAHTRCAVGSGGQFHRLAGAFWNQFPRISLIIHFRGTSAGGAFACGAVVLASQGDAKAFFRVLSGGGGSDTSQSGRKSASNGEGFELCRHVISFRLGCGGGRSAPRRIASSRLASKANHSGVIHRDVSLRDLATQGCFFKMTHANNRKPARITPEHAKVS